MKHGPPGFCQGYIFQLNVHYNTWITVSDYIPLLRIHAWSRKQQDSSLGSLTFESTYTYTVFIAVYFFYIKSEYIVQQWVSLFSPWICFPPTTLTPHWFFNLNIWRTNAATMAEEVLFSANLNPLEHNQQRKLEAVSLLLVPGCFSANYLLSLKKASPTRVIAVKTEITTLL